MYRLLFLVSFVFVAFYNNAQIVFEGISPASIVGTYSFTYTSDQTGTISDPWGGSLASPLDAITGELMLVDDGSAADSLGCEETGNDLSGKIAVIYRGGCNFYNKIKYAQNRGAIAVLVINNTSGLIYMRGSQVAGENELIVIPAVSISQEDGAKFRAAMDKGPVTVFMGNKTGYYTNNIGIYNELTVSPRSYAIPSLTAQNEGDVVLSLGTYLINRGSNPVTDATVTINIKKGTEILHTETSTPKSLTATGAITDTAVVGFTDYNLSDLSVGKYTVEYFTSMGNITDLSKVDDTLRYNFEITDNIYSLAPLDEDGFPVANYYPLSSTPATTFMQCIMYQNANASRIGAEGMYFSVKYYGSTAPYTPISVDKEEITIYAYQWDDEFNDDAASYSDNFTSLSEINNTAYNIIGNLQDTMLYVPFSNSIPLENDLKYLFCVAPSNTSIRLGNTTDAGYRFNNYIFSEGINPMQIADRWYSGWSGYSAPAFGVKTADKASLGIKESKIIKSSIYPNPTVDEVNISMNAEGNAKITLTDISGKIVFSNTIELVNGKTNLKLTNIDAGMYIVNIQLENGVSEQFNIVKN